MLLLIALVLATAVKHFVFNAHRPKTPRPRSATEQDAKAAKRWLGSASATPDSLRQDFSELKIVEAWYETVVENDYFLVWFPAERTAPGHFLCFRFPIWSLGTFDFYLEGNEEAMAVREHGQEQLYWARRDGEPRTARAEAWYVVWDQLQYDYNLRVKQPLARVTFAPREPR